MGSVTLPAPPLRDDARASGLAWGYTAAGIALGAVVGHWAIERYEKRSRLVVRSNTSGPLGLGVVPDPRDPQRGFFGLGIARWGKR